ncbi:uncharacterized protein LOC132796715 [Drosophila nasuta]|uniref:uncharacterized protein LOC132796715 n=1 Tax=Drosophila nasuta TaxID=42062 RepID=UPI00295F34F9|nr:uncharacterized protein LOC132796715 [Drosophila nasuta]
MSRDSSIRKSVFVGLPPDLKPWQRIDWPPFIQTRLFKDWGQYYSHRLCNKKALASFRSALELSREMETRSTTALPSVASFRPSSTVQQQQSLHYQLEAYKTLHARSKCHRGMAQNEDAYRDVLEAQRLMELKGQLNSGLILDKCDMLLDCNRFEENLCQLYNEASKFRGHSIHDRFVKHRALTHSVLDDCLGSRLDPFMLQNLPLILRNRATTAAFVPRPMWQRLREKSECDVESVTLKNEISLSPLEQARRRVTEKVYNYHYLGSSAIDVKMLQGLRNNKELLNPLYVQTADKIHEFSCEQYAIVRKFMKMMHVRRPIYPIWEKHRENYLYYVEYQTRRDCYRILRDVRRLRLEHNIDRLTDYVEHIMSTKIVLKTQRTLPWKFEFINEVYNMLGLAHIDRREVPKDVDFLNPKNQDILYRLPKDRMRNHSSIFGGHNVYEDVAKATERAENSTLIIDKLKERFRHSRFGIERAYLMFAIASQHFKESHFGKCVRMARNAAKEANACNSLIWRFNASFLICKVHASLNRHERLRDSLQKTNTIARKLNSPQLLAYLELCNAVNSYQLEFRRYHRKRKERGSRGALV